MRRLTRTFSSPLFTVLLCLSLAFPPNCAAACPELSRRTLRVSQPELRSQRAGIEEALDPPDEAALLDLEQELTEKAGSNWSSKIRVRKVPNTEALTAAAKGDRAADLTRERVVALLPAVQQSSADDIYVVDDPDLQPTGHAGAWRGPAGTLFLSELVMRLAPVEVLAEALKTGDPAGLQAWWKSEHPHPAPVEKTASPVAHPPAPPPAPVSPRAPAKPAAPEVLTSAKLKEELHRWVPALLKESVSIPNSVLHSQTSGWVAVDTSGFTVPSSFFVQVKLGDFSLQVLLPDPGVRGLPTRYTVQLNPNEAVERVKKRNPAFKEFYRQHSDLVRLSRLFPHPKHSGESLLRQALSILDQGRSGDLVREEEPGFAPFRETVRRLLVLSTLINRAHVRIEQAYVPVPEEKKNQPSRVPGEIARDTLNALIPHLAEWPYLQAYLRSARDEILPDREMKAMGVQVHLYVLAAAVMEAFHADFGKESGVLQRSSHRFYRQAVREEILRLQRELSQVDGQQVPLELSAEIVDAVTWAAGGEIAEELYGMAVEGATRRGSASPDLSNRLNAAGAIFMNAAGEPERFIAGAGAVAETRWLVGHLQVAPLKNWAGDLPAVALVVPTFSRVPNPDQVQWFLSDAALVHRSFGRPVEVYLAAAGEDGSVTLYRPSFSTADPEVWGKAMERVTRTDSFELFSDALADRLDTSSPGGGKLAATALAKEAERSRLIEKVKRHAKDLRSVVEAEVAQVTDQRTTAWIMQGVDAALGADLAKLASTQFGPPGTKAHNAKIWDSDRAIKKLYDEVSAAAGERMGVSIMNQLFVPVSLPWTLPPPDFLRTGPPAEGSAAPATPPVDAAPRVDAEERILDLVSRAVEKGLIREEQRGALADFIGNVWIPSKSGAVNYPRLVEAWNAHLEEARKAHLEELERQKRLQEMYARGAHALEQALEAARLRTEEERTQTVQRDAQRLADEAAQRRAERAQAVPGLVTRLAATNVRNPEKVSGILEESGTILARMDPVQEAGSRNPLESARTALGNRFAQGFLGSAGLALSSALSRPDSRNLEVLSQVAGRIEGALAIAGDLQPVRQSLEDALNNVRLGRRVVEAHIRIEAIPVAEDSVVRAELEQGAVLQGELAALPAMKEWHTLLSNRRKKMARTNAEQVIQQADQVAQSLAGAEPQPTQPVLDRLAGALPAVADYAELRQSLELAEGRVLQAVTSAQQRADEQAGQFQQLLDDEAAAKEKQRQDELKRRRRAEARAANQQRPELETVRKAATAVLGNNAQVPHLSANASKLLKDLKANGIAEPDKVNALRENAQARLRNPKVQQDPVQFSLYNALLQIAELHDQAESAVQADSNGDQAGADELLAGAEEDTWRAAARARENTVIFLKADLFDPAGMRQLDELTLVGLGIDLGRAPAGAEEGRGADVQVVLVTGETAALLLKQHVGWRIITVQRERASDPRPLPLGALVAVLRDALKAGKPVFDVVVTHYLHLWDRTFQQELQGLEAGTSA